MNHFDQSLPGHTLFPVHPPALGVWHIDRRLNHPTGNQSSSACNLVPLGSGVPILRLLLALAVAFCMGCATTEPIYYFKNTDRSRVFEQDDAICRGRATYIKPGYISSKTIFRHLPPVAVIGPAKERVDETVWLGCLAEFGWIVTDRKDSRSANFAALRLDRLFGCPEAERQR